ncbi:MAG: lysylphosphatidylglycerol synthase transmembrane domain-containing protein [Pirellulaceae bacterium]
MSRVSVKDRRQVEAAKSGLALKHYLVTFLKFALPLAIIAWLLASLPADQYRQFIDRPKHWPMLLGALAIVFCAVSLTFVRWYLLVRALDLRFPLQDAFRLGFLGFLFNFISVGSVGGDLFKAFFIAREQPGRRTEAVATVVVDRVVGVYALVLLTSSVICIGGIPNANRDVTAICQLTLAATALGVVGIVSLLILGFAGGTWFEFMTGVPKIGKTLGQLMGAARIYRQRWRTVAFALLISVMTHAMFTYSLYLIARALFERVPTLHEHFILVPLGMVAGALPLAPAGFGAFEFAIERLYQIIPAASDIDVAGILVALVYRLLTILVAIIGIVIYWSSRREVRQVLDDVEQEAAREYLQTEADHARSAEPRAGSMHLE